MLEFGNQLPMDIGGFPSNVHAMDFGPETSVQSSQAAFSQLQQQLHMEQPWNSIDSPFLFEPESALLTGGEEILQSYIDNNDESCWMQSPLFQDTYSFSPTVETPFCCELQGWTAANCDQPPRSNQAIDNNDESCWMQSPLFQDTYCFSPTVETPFCCELQGWTAANCDQPPRLNQAIDNNDESCWMQSPLFQDTYCFSPTVETPFCCELQGWIAANCDQPPRSNRAIF
ncbi:uncharacterized protein LOC111394479 [Olea europaea var. sylvestris]|uniref:uncharacterized protein LOC111394479 n=1 Tax=Olea europaea var. sylvestris TaxID=158386 RepID=UPI000C1CF872|nr:uncharacterized protein LOC111394479 [Olea europaea var. sylvestris]